MFGTEHNLHGSITPMVGFNSMASVSRERIFRDVHLIRIKACISMTEFIVIFSSLLVCMYSPWEFCIPTSCLKEATHPQIQHHNS